MKAFVLAGVAATAVAGSAFAADIPAPAAPAPISPVAVVTAPAPFSWSGAFVGVFGAVAAADFDYAATATGFTPDPLTLGLGVTGRGGIAGVQAGYDFQFGNFVVGAVADIALTNVEAEIALGFASGGDTITATIYSELDYLGTVRARLGYALDRFLVYAHGGLAYGETTQGLTLDTSFAGGLAGEFDDGEVKFGYTVGAGAEYAITDSLSLATEYAFTDLGQDDLATIDFGGADVVIGEELSFHTVRVALNYRF